MRRSVARYLPEEEPQGHGQGRHRLRACGPGAWTARHDAVASVERVLRFRRVAGRGALHVLGLLQGVQEVGAGPRRPHAHRPQAGRDHPGGLGRGHGGSGRSRYGRTSEGLRVRGMPALLQLPVRRGILQNRRAGLDRRPCPYVLLLRRRDPRSRAGQLQDRGVQEHQRGAHRQRAVPPHERALRVRRRARQGQKAQGQGERGDGSRPHRAPGHARAEGKAVHVPRRVQLGPCGPGRRHQLAPLPKARGQQGERIPRPGKTAAHPAAGDSLRDDGPQGGHRQF